VDARWLEQSPSRFYREQLSARFAREKGKAGVLDYLEKIFQIPLWLRPLDFNWCDWLRRRGIRSRPQAVGSRRARLPGFPAPQAAWAQGFLSTQSTPVTLSSSSVISLKRPATRCMNPSGIFPIRFS